MNKSVQLCLEILGRYFPEQSGRVEEAQKLFCVTGMQTNALWKKLACDWLASNLQVKPAKRVRKSTKK